MPKNNNTDENAELRRKAESLLESSHESDKDMEDMAPQGIAGVSSAMDEPRLELRIQDGVKFVNDTDEQFDVVIVDSTEPIGPAKPLFDQAFYKQVAAILSSDGIMVTQSESPFYHLSFMVDVHRRLKAVFPEKGFYLAPVPTYPSGSWSFLIGSKAEGMSFPRCRQNDVLPTRYYNRQIHLAGFTLPRFLAEALEG